MEQWRKVWRDAVVPLLSRKELEVLLTAVQTDDTRLLQGATTMPPALSCVQDWPVEGACLLGFCAWQGRENCNLVAAVEEAFVRLCFEIDQELKEPAGCRWFINWFDETPRDEVRTALLPEIELALTTKE